MSRWRYSILSWYTRLLLMVICAISDLDNFHEKDALYDRHDESMIKFMVLSEITIYDCRNGFNFYCFIFFQVDSGYLMIYVTQYILLSSDINEITTLIKNIFKSKVRSFLIFPDISYRENIWIMERSLIWLKSLSGSYHIYFYILTWSWKKISKSYFLFRI